MAIVLCSPTTDVALSPTAVTQLAQRQFPHAGVAEIVNCRCASHVTSGYPRKLHLIRNFTHLRALAIFRIQIHAFAAWLQGNAQVTISGTA
jgi:hypothetical protein